MLWCTRPVLDVGRPRVLVAMATSAYDCTQDVESGAAAAVESDRRTATTTMMKLNWRQTTALERRRASAPHPAAHTSINTPVSAASRIIDNVINTVTLQVSVNVSAQIKMLHKHRHRRRISVNFRGHDIFARKYV